MSNRNTLAIWKSIRCRARVAVRRYGGKNVSPQWLVLGDLVERVERETGREDVPEREGRAVPQRPRRGRRPGRPLLPPCRPAVARRGIRRHARLRLSRFEVRCERTMRRSAGAGRCAGWREGAQL